MINGSHNVKYTKKKVNHILQNFLLNSHTYILSARWGVEALRRDSDEVGSGRADVPANHGAKLLTTAEQVPGGRQQDDTEGGEDAGD